MGFIYFLIHLISSRLFLVHKDGSGTELLSSHTVEELLFQAYSDPTIALLKEPLPDKQGSHLNILWIKNWNKKRLKIIGDNSIRVVSWCYLAIFLFQMYNFRLCKLSKKIQKEVKGRTYHITSVFVSAPDEFGITILKPSHQSVWSQWLLGKQKPDITPPNLKNRSWHDFPRVEVHLFLHILYIYR